MVSNLSYLGVTSPAAFPPAAEPAAPEGSPGAPSQRRKVRRRRRSGAGRVRRDFGGGSARRARLWRTLGLVLVRRWGGLGRLDLHFGQGGIARNVSTSVTLSPRFVIARVDGPRFTLPWAICRHERSEKIAVSAARRYAVPGKSNQGSRGLRSFDGRTANSVLDTRTAQTPIPDASARRLRFLAIVMMCAAMFCFAGLDTSAKWSGRRLADGGGRMGPLRRGQPVHAVCYPRARSAPRAAGAAAGIAGRPLAVAVRLDHRQFSGVAATAARRDLHDLVSAADVRGPAGGAAARGKRRRRASGRDRGRLSRRVDRNASGNPRVPADRPGGDRRRLLRRGLRARHAPSRRVRFPGDYARLDAVSPASRC